VSACASAARFTGYAPTQPVESPRGSKDAFYIKIDKHYGSSDHVTYMQHGIPAVMFITWPDMWYHSSEDTPDKQDSTQYKRAAAVGLGSLAALASGTDQMAARILADNLGRGLSRMGESHTKGLGYMADAVDAAALNTAYKEAKNAIAHQAKIEKAVVRSASVLWTDVAAGQKKTASFEPLIDARAGSLLNEVKAAYQLQAAQRSATPAEPVMTAEEKEAANLIVEAVPPTPGAGGPGGGFGGGGGGGPRGPQGPSLPDEFNAELGLLTQKKLSILEIRDFLSGEFTPLPLADVTTVLRAQEKAGRIKITPKPVETKPARK
jgi:aminopeptidase YwaD